MTRSSLAGLALVVVAASPATAEPSTAPETGLMAPAGVRGQLPAMRTTIEASEEGATTRPTSQPTTAPTTTASTQPTTSPATAPDPDEPEARLDEQWLGVWKGECRVIQPVVGEVGRVSMRLAIRPMEVEEGDQPRWSWTITYENGESRQRHEYTLVPVKDEAGQVVPDHYLVDEGNGVVLDQFVVGDVMQGHFIVAAGEQQTVLHARYSLQETKEGKPAMGVEISSYDGNFARTNAPEGQPGAGVASRPLMSVQTGVLLKEE